MNQIDQNTFENQLGLGDYINIFTMHVKKIVFLIFGTLLSLIKHTQLLQFIKQHQQLL